MINQEQFLFQKLSKKCCGKEKGGLCIRGGDLRAQTVILIAKLK